MLGGATAIRFGVCYRATLCTLASAKSSESRICNTTACSFIFSRGLISCRAINAGTKARTTNANITKASTSNPCQATDQCFGVCYRATLASTKPSGGRIRNTAACGLIFSCASSTNAGTNAVTTNASSTNASTSNPCQKTDHCVGACYRATLASPRIASITSASKKATANTSNPCQQPLAFTNGL